MLYFYLKSFFLLTGIGTNYKNFNVVATWGWYCAVFQSFSFFFFSVSIFTVFQSCLLLCYSECFLKYLKLRGKLRQSVLCPVTLVNDLLCASVHFPAAVLSALPVLSHVTLLAALRGQRCC